MLETIRAFFRQRSPSSTPARQRRELFLRQQDLAKELRRVMHAYERRLDYLQTHLLKVSDERVQGDHQLFDEAHHELTRLMARLRIADQDAELLMREWRDWLDHHDQRTLSREAKERLEILRSELTVRGLLLPEGKRSVTTARVATPKKTRSYQPTALSQDTLSAFERVYKARLEQESDWLKRSWKKALTHQEHVSWKVFLTKRYKRLHAWKKGIGERILG